jgi:hypothetical protein
MKLPLVVEGCVLLARRDEVVMLHLYDLKSCVARQFSYLMSSYLFMINLQTLTDSVELTRWRMVHYMISLVSPISLRLFVHEIKLRF